MSYSHKINAPSFIDIYWNFFTRIGNLFACCVCKISYIISNSRFLHIFCISVSLAFFIFSNDVFLAYQTNKNTYHVHILTTKLNGTIFRFYRDFPFISLFNNCFRFKAVKNTIIVISLSVGCCYAACHLKIIL